MSNKAKLLVSNNLAVNQQEDDEFKENQDVINYKGVFYNEDTVNHYYEGGAHFQFKNLCRRLEKLFFAISSDRKGDTLYLNDKRELQAEKLGK